MRRDKISYILFLLSCVLQVCFLKFRVAEPSPFAFVLGIKCELGYDIRYLEICALCLPVCMWLLLFSDYYSFYMENYGRMLLVRNCSRVKMLASVYGRMAVGMVEVFLLQLVINMLFFCDYLWKHPILVMKGMIAGLSIGLVLLILELGLCAVIRGERVHLILNLYVIVSCFVHFYIENPIIQFIFLPGKLIHMGKICENTSGWEFFVKAAGMEIVLIGAIFGISAWYCKRKDIL